jgi:hypothetical protein
MREHNNTWVNGPEDLITLKEQEIRALARRDEEMAALLRQMRDLKAENYELKHDAKWIEWGRFIFGLAVGFALGCIVAIQVCGMGGGG